MIPQSRIGWLGMGLDLEPQGEHRHLLQRRRAVGGPARATAAAAIVGSRCVVVVAKLRGGDHQATARVVNGGHPSVAVRRVVSNTDICSPACQGVVKCDECGVM